MSSETEMFDYLRNINTMAGPKMGQSIDPTKPGPTADRIQTRREELERRLAILDGDASMGDFLLSPEENRERIAIRAELSRLRNPELNERGEPMDGATIARGRKPTDAENAPLRSNKPPVTDSSGDVFADLGVPSPATSPGPQDVREKIANILRRYGVANSSADHIAAQVLAALAQSDAQPVGWQYRWNANGRKSEWFSIRLAQLSYYQKLPEYEVRPLYTLATLNGGSK